MKLFKDVAVGESFVLHNGQQLIRISPLTAQSHNCLDYPWYQKRFAITDDTECLTVDELMELSEPLSMENSEEVDPSDVMTIMQKYVANEFQDAFSRGFDKFDWAAAAAEEARQKSAAIARGIWTVETKIGNNGCSVEVSAVIKGSHGEKSWGWHDNGDTKYVVLRVDALYQKTPVLRSIIELAEEEACRICRQKN
ncbi:unknown function [Enterobacter phage vB_EclM_Q7622]|uniref:unknown function n=1 Tax=Enterobacter phage vB_EclM_Q7622 TaxID=2908628 RepID=UPI0023294AE4|nr:unknown function [Enterobacter phage vB_EclM_Q7622]UIS65667.1 hypothetical protein Q76222_00152 [Enterobacter phage vB_EclM_Q7622]